MTQMPKPGDVSYWYFRAHYDNGERDDFEFETNGDCLRFVSDFVVERANSQLSEHDEGEKRIIDLVRAEAREPKLSPSDEGIWGLSDLLCESYEWGEAKLMRYGRTALLAMGEAVAGGKE
jgi:hypothetical protein